MASSSLTDTKFMRVGTHGQGVCRTLQESYRHLSPPSLDPANLPPPLPFIVEYDPAVDDLQQFDPLFNALNSVTRTILMRPQHGFVRSVIKAFAELDVWSHRSPVYAALKAGTTSRFIGYSYESTLMYSLGWYPGSQHPAEGFSGVYRFSSIIRAAVWLMAGGNENLKEWGLEEWKGTKLDVPE